MKRIVLVSASIEVVVDTKRPEDAGRLAADHVTRVLAAGGLTASINHAIGHWRRPLPPEAKAVTYTCSSCDVSSLKEDFGPGWIKCPSCGAVGTGITNE